MFIYDVTLDEVCKPIFPAIALITGIRISIEKCLVKIS